jgi:hypothetical protein
LNLSFDSYFKLWLIFPNVQLFPACIAVKQGGLLFFLTNQYVEKHRYLEFSENVNNDYPGLQTGGEIIWKGSTVD